MLTMELTMSQWGIIHRWKGGLWVTAEETVYNEQMNRRRFRLQENLSKLPVIILYPSDFSCRLRTFTTLNLERFRQFQRRGLTADSHAILRSLSSSGAGAYQHYEYGPKNTPQPTPGNIRNTNNHPGMFWKLSTEEKLHKTFLQKSWKRDAVPNKSWRKLKNR